MNTDNFDKLLAMEEGFNIAREKFTNNPTGNIEYFDGGTDYYYPYKYKTFMDYHKQSFKQHLKGYEILRYNIARGTSCTHKWYNGQSIDSVKRLSDGEIISIGDEMDNGENCDELIEGDYLGGLWVSTNIKLKHGYCIGAAKKTKTSIVNHRR